MRQFFWSCRQHFLSAFAFVFSSKRLERLIRFCANRLQLRRAATGRLVFPYIHKKRYRSVQILVYHRVNDEGDPFFPATPIKTFARQMEYVADHFTVCPLEEAIDRMKRKDVPDNAIVVTFDDGYRDNYLHAFPILSGLAIPATIFLTTGVLSSPKVLWHDRIFAAFRETQELLLSDYGKKPKSYCLRTLTDKLVAQKEILPFLWSLEEQEKSFWITQLIEKLRVEDRQEMSGLMLSWDEVMEMQQGGMTFGSHTFTHPILSRISAEQARKEIFESKKIIEEKLGTTVTTFAYPIGRKDDFTQATKMILREAGYRCALTTVSGVNESDQDLFELRRATPWDQDINLFGMRLYHYKVRS